MKSYIKIVFLTFTLICIIPTSYAGSNEPILVSTANSTEIERFGIDASGQYIVFNEYQNGILNRFSREVTSTDTLNVLKTGLQSPFEDTFVFDTDDSLILSIDSTNNSLSRTTFDGQSSIQLSAPNDESPISFAGQISNNDFDVFLTSNRNLYSIKSDGTNSATLLSSGFEVDRFRVTNDRQTVLFSAEIFPNNQRIFSIPIDGSSEATQVHVLPENSDLDGNMIINSDNSRAIYIVETFLDNGVETLQLYSTPIDGSLAPTTLGPSVTGTSIDIDFELSNDGAFVAFLLEESVFNAVGAIDTLFTVPIDGSTSATIIDIFPNIIDFDITNDSQTLLYSEVGDNQIIGLASRLFSSPINASSSPINITPSEFVEFSIGSRDFQTSEDSRYVFYTAQNLFTFDTKLFRSNVDGSGDSTQISANIPTVTNSEVREFTLDSINSRVIYSTGDSGFSSNQLFITDFDGRSNFSKLASKDANFYDLNVSRNGDTIAYTTSSNINSFIPSQLFILDISINSEPLCFPIKTKNDNFVTICL